MPREYTIARGSKQDARMRSSVVRPIASVRSRGAAVFQEDSARFTVARRQTLRLPSSVLSAHYQPGTFNVLVNHPSGCSPICARDSFPPADRVA